MKRRPLVDIGIDLSDLHALLDDLPDELTDDDREEFAAALRDTLQGVEGELAGKVEAVLALIFERERDEESYQRLSDEARARARRERRAIDATKRWLGESLDRFVAAGALKKPSVKTRLGTARTQGNGGAIPLVAVPGEDTPDELMTVTVRMPLPMWRALQETDGVKDHAQAVSDPAPMRAEIRKRLDAGEDVPGWSLGVRGRGLRIS